MKVKILIDNNEYEIELDEKIINKIKEGEELKYKRWRAGLNEAYFYLFKNGQIDKCLDKYDPVDNFRYNSGNYGETHEALEEYKKKLLYLQQYLDYIGEDIPKKDDWKNKYFYKFYAYYSYYDNKIEFYYDCQIKRCGVIYSKSKEKIEKFIKEIGEDNFKKYILEVEE